MSPGEEIILGKTAYVGWDIARILQNRGHDAYWDGKGWHHSTRCARCEAMQKQQKETL
jgi:hypothetical protein